MAETLQLQVVATARTALGDAYGWGDEGPTRFDCSGLCQWAYAQNGIAIPRTSQEQALGGIPVSRDELALGDLVIYYPDASHVAMYSGAGNVIQASTYGVPVEEVPVDSAGPFNQARRYLTEGTTMTLYGVDVSNNNWTSVAQCQQFIAALPGEGYAWVEAKVSEGNYYKDPYWAPTLQACSTAGLPCIGYHYVTTDAPASQAQTFVSNGGGNVVMLDFEANSGDITNFWNVVNAFNAAGVQVALSYVPQWYWQEIGSPDLSQVPGLISSSYYQSGTFGSVEYNDAGGDTGPGWNPYGGGQPVIWQFTDGATVAGISVDANAFKGTQEQLQALLTGASPVTPKSHHVVLTVAGTGSDLWNQGSPQPAGVGAQLAANEPDRYFWQPVGDYPAATFPMGPSVTAGVQSLIYLTTGETYQGFNITPGQTYRNNSLILLGYSQGAMVVCQFIQWCYQWNRMDILSRIVCVGVWGNPQRLKGFASGNEFAGWPLPGQVDGADTGGIAQAVNTNGAVNMTLAQMQPQLPHPVTHFWGDFVNTNNADKGATELYANAPQNDTGTVEQSIFNLVQNFDLATAWGLAQDLGHPIQDLLAIFNGFLFLAAQGNADHYSYDTTPIYNFVALAGGQTDPFGPI